MSDIDFQNGFIVGMATRGLTISKTVVEGPPIPFHCGVLSKIYSVVAAGVNGILFSFIDNASIFPYNAPDVPVVALVKTEINTEIYPMNFIPFQTTGGLFEIVSIVGTL